MAQDGRGPKGLDDHPGKPKELPRYLPPPGPAAANPVPVALEALPPLGAGPRFQADQPLATGRVGTGPLPALDLAALASLAEAQLAASGPAPVTWRALGELGVVASLSQVAAAYARTELDLAAIGASLRAFGEQLQGVSEQVMALPGVGEALMALGGAGVIASGVGQLAEALEQARLGKKIAAGLHLASGGAKLVGGLAQVLSPWAPPLAALGGGLTLAGVGLQLGALAAEPAAELPDAVQRVQALGQGAWEGFQEAAQGAWRLVAQGGGLQELAPLPILSNHGGS